MAEKTSKKETPEKSETPKPRCGIIMPISEIDGCPAQHWADVKDVLLEVISQTEFEGDLVSNAGEIRIIHETIVQNIYNNEMIICDVSGKNPNVMFELGLRLAFDKPAIIIKDDVTNYSFDTSPIEHLEYPRDLNYKKINDFKILLKEKLIATHKKAEADNNYSPFLKSFGQYKVTGLKTTEISSDFFVVESLKEIKVELRRISNASFIEVDRIEGKKLVDNLILNTASQDVAEEIISIIKGSLIENFEYAISKSGSRYNINLEFIPRIPRFMVTDIIEWLEMKKFEFGFYIL